jgi:hypothetical protein
MRLVPASCCQTLAVSILALALTGCTLTTTTSSVPATVQGAVLTGQVYGGQQPIAGAHVFLFAANTTGYGNTSVSLLQNATGTTLDSSSDATSGDYYVTTNASGTFSITSDYSCTPNTQVYLYTVGGNPGAGVNTAAAMMGVLGNCPGTNTFLGTLSTITLNELTTIAAAYAFAGYATDALHVSSSGTTLALTGIANAFANAGNLVSVATGAALTYTPGSTGTLGSFTHSNAGQVPQEEIFSLGNILAACIDSGASTSANCNTLLSDAGNGGTPAPDTATAAINIAHHPGTNVAALFGLQSATSPYPSTITTTPNDWTIAINYTANLTGVGAMFNNLAIDAAGDVWIANENTVIEVSPSGVEMSGTQGYFGGGLSYPLSIAIDTTGDVWIANYTGNSVTEFSKGGAVLSGANGYAVGGYPYSVAIDASNDVWVTNSALLDHNTMPWSVSELNGSTGANINGSPFIDASINSPEGVAIDASGNAWIANLGANATEISKTGAVTGFPNGSPLAFSEPTSVALDNAGNKWFDNDYGSASIGYYFTELVGNSSGFTQTSYSSHGQQLSQSFVAIDGSGNIFLTTVGNGVNPNYSTWVGEFSNAGAILTPSNGYHDVGSTCEDASGIAVDGSGDVWVSCGGPATLMEYVGVATPVVTPLVANLVAPYNAPANKP